MLKKAYAKRHLLSIFAVLTLLALNAVWAGSNTRQKTVKKGDGGQINIDHDPQGSSVGARITKQSVDKYMDEKGLDRVTITVQTIEEWIDDGNGNSHRRYTFVFGPSGCYFDPEPLELKLKGNFVSDDVQLYSEVGEAVPFSRNGQADQVTFYIPHFSSYSYDDYY